MSIGQQLRSYPRAAALRGGETITIRSLELADEEALLAFFREIPEDDRFFLKDDVTSPEVIRGWTKNLDYDRVLPMVAIDGGGIIGEGALVKRRGSARNHVGEIRLTVASSWRNRGVGTELIRALCDVAADADLDAVLFEIVEDCEAPAIEAATVMGFVRIGRLEGGVRDREGHLHDVVTLAMPLGRYWSQF
jgi:GNAT superfamily N-acetyltransferase